MGRYWAKMDDDDDYSRYYLEELVYYYRASQADVVGRQAANFFFSETDYTAARQHTYGATMTTSYSVHLSGATLSADISKSIPAFSFADRNAADSNWVARIKDENVRIFSADGTSIVVYRDEDASHTWKIADRPQILKRFSVLTSGTIFPRLEK